MILLAVAAVWIFFAAALRRKWPPAVRATTAWDRARPVLATYIRASPATFAYLGIITVTTWVLLGSSGQVVDLLLREHSTSLHQLRIEPVRVLIRSAFWAPGYALLAWVVLFAVILAPAERWLGARRLMVVFAAGHVLATLATAYGLWVAIHYGWASSTLENTVDVGASYGVAAVAAVFTFRLPPAWRWPWATCLVIAAGAALLIGGTFTDAGHLLALAIGFACYRLTTAPAVRSRAAGPIWSTQPALRQGGDGTAEDSGSPES